MAVELSPAGSPHRRRRVRSTADRPSSAGRRGRDTTPVPRRLRRRRPRPPCRAEQRLASSPVASCRAAALRAAWARPVAGSCRAGQSRLAAKRPAVVIRAGVAGPMAASFPATARPHPKVVPRRARSAAREARLPLRHPRRIPEGWAEAESRSRSSRRPKIRERGRRPAEGHPEAADRARRRRRATRCRSTLGGRSWGTPWLVVERGPTEHDRGCPRGSPNESASMTIRRDILDEPCSRSVKVMGTSTTLPPARRMR